MEQKSQGVQSTSVKVKEEVEQKNIDTDSDKRPNKQRGFFLKSYFAKDTIYTNQTGNFPVCSRRGRKYIVVMCKIDRSAMMVDTIKNIMEGEIMRMYQKLI